MRGAEWYSQHQVLLIHCQVTTDHRGKWGLHKMQIELSVLQIVSVLTLLFLYLKCSLNLMLLSEFSTCWCLVIGPITRIVQKTMDSVWNEIKIGQAILGQNFRTWHPFFIIGSCQASLLINRSCRKISYIWHSAQGNTLIVNGHMVTH